MEGLECSPYRVTIDFEDFESYELTDIDGSCCGDISNVTVRCMKCGAILEIV
jgi:hypothetical protein